MEGLGQEALQLAGAGHDQLVLFGQLVHAQDRDDVLQRLVGLQDALHFARGLVVFLAHDPRIKAAGGAVQRVDGREDRHFRDGTRQHGRRIQVREGGGRRRVGQVVRGHVDRLHRGDRALLGRRDAFLQRAHVGRQRRLVTHGGRDAAQQRRHFRARLGEAEDVVDEEQHVLALLVAEVFRHREARERDARARARRLVHLAIDQRHLGTVGVAVVQLDDARVAHLVIEIVALTRALTHAGEDGHAAMRLRDVVDQFLNGHGLADAGAAEQADLAALQVGREQVDDLDARHQDLGGGRLVLEGGGFAVDGVGLLRHHGAAFVDRLTDHVHDAAERAVADRHGNARAGIRHLGAADETVRGVHGDGADGALAEMLRDLKHQRLLADLEGQRVQDRGQLGGELHVHDGAEDLRDLADIVLHDWFVLLRPPRHRR